MRAIILAAGLGSRIEKINPDKPKCLIDIGGISILQRLVNQFLENGIDKIDIITGYKSILIKKKFNRIANVHFYPHFKKTNNLYTLYYFKYLLKDDTIISFADIIVENNIIRKLAKSDKNITALIDTSAIRMGTMRVVLKKKILNYIGNYQSYRAHGNFIGLLKIKKKTIKSFKSSMNKILEFNEQRYYTEALNYLIFKKFKINTLDIKKNFWTEIDTPLDYKKAKNNYKKLVKLDRKYLKKK